MTEVYKNLFVGGKDDYRPENLGDWTYVHATVSTHRPEVDFGTVLNISGNDLYLNWVDGDASLYEEGGTKIFSEVLDFIEEKIKTKKVLVHCDFGESRSPTLALLYLAKRLNVISNDSFDRAREDFAKIYPNYYPSGIRIYVRAHWDEIK